MSLLRDVSTPGCHYSGMTLPRDVITSRCHYSGMSLLRAVITPGCHYSGMSLLWDVITPGCHYSGMSLLGCHNSGMSLLQDVITPGMSLLPRCHQPQPQSLSSIHSSNTRIHYDYTWSLGNHNHIGKRVFDVYILIQTWLRRRLMTVLI